MCKNQNLYLADNTISGVHVFKKQKFTDFPPTVCVLNVQQNPSVQRKERKLCMSLNMVNDW